MMLSPASGVQVLLGASGAEPVFVYGRWWTVLSAAWLHGGVLHILFNMLWVRQLGPATAEIYGPGRMVIIYAVAGAVGFTLSSLAGFYLGSMPIPFLRGAFRTVGASASIFGLLGALVYYGGAAAARLSAARRWATQSRSASWASSCRASTTTRTPADFSAAISPRMWLDPLEAGAHGSSHWRRALSRALRPRDRRVGRDGLPAVVLSDPSFGPGFSRRDPCRGSHASFGV